MFPVLSWSVPLGRIAGITVKAHIFFPLLILGLLLRNGAEKGAPAAIWLETALFLGMLFFIVLLHELGHCVAARFVDGDASEILLWPLGGLASVDIPHTPRANFITAAGGPLVNLLLGTAAVGGLIANNVGPPLSPWWFPIKFIEGGSLVVPDGLGLPETFPASHWLVWLARFFWLNWILLILNVVVVGFPLDGGRMLQAILWPRLGFRQATLTTVYTGFIAALVLAVISVMDLPNPVLLFMLAFFIGISCHQQWVILEMGGEDSPFGYDFSQGYTSLEGRERARRRRRPNLLQRWLQRRAARKLHREVEKRESEERRMDELLEKVQREGLTALSDEERRFLTRVSAKYRNRQ
jgi:stage IV sporulation protein FB